AAREPRLLEDVAGFQRWHGNGAVGYLALGRVVERQIEHPPTPARLVVCERTFPTGMLGHHVRRLAEAGLVAVLTATSPARLGPPGGGAVLLVAEPEADPVPALRAHGVRLPGS